ncbi:hypothetical protein F4778DRAFT_441661 [Xylariomycetidae sp. FL2044]|nr:hypothetical protein F4778DRAFT_441661 [Xylariomycetidae sp. FL2044]
MASSSTPSENGGVLELSGLVAALELSCVMAAAKQSVPVKGTFFPESVWANIFEHLLNDPPLPRRNDLPKKRGFKKISPFFNTDFPTMAALSRTCHGINRIAQPYLYRTVLLMDNYECAKVAQGLIANPERAEHIKNFKVGGWAPPAPTSASLSPIAEPTQELWRHYHSSGDASRLVMS